MAGEGSRFKSAGYVLPKPMIMVNNKTMIQTVCENINLNGKYIFVVKKDDLIKYDIENHIKSFCNNYEIVVQEGKLEGAVLSALLAKEYIDNNEHLLVVNSDQYIEWDSNKDINNIINSGVDGSILTFNSNETKWSYVKRNEYNIIEKVSEKNVISNEATCGIYYWNKGSDFVKFANDMIQKNIKVNNEFYICPVFNEAILNKKIISPYPIKKMYGLGTPEDLENFLNK
jgi:NDP-sugar pyrophosphorylase family protein